MTTDPANIVSEFQRVCAGLIEFAKDASPGTSAFRVEGEIFKQVLKAGALAMSAFLNCQAKHYHWKTATSPAGDVLPYKEERNGIYYSIFGEIPFRRSYYHSDGTEGTFPLDAALNLPPEGPSDYRRMMLETLSMDVAFMEATKFFAQYFALSASSRAVQSCILADSVDAEAFYDQAKASPPVADATILVAEADGKCVPIVRRQLDTNSRGDTGIRSAKIDPPAKQSGQAPSLRALQSGQAPSLRALPGQPKGPRKREGKTKEATLVSISTHIPFHRTPDQVWKSLFGIEEEDACVSDADHEDKAQYTDSHDSVGSKRVWASLEGKKAALKQAKVWADQHELSFGDHFTARLRLTDGQEHLQKAVGVAFPDYVPILDLMHALGQLWKAAGIKFGATTPEGRQWARERALLMLQGQSASIVQELDVWLATMKDGEPKILLGNVANYLERNLEAMKYDEYLKAGWPIASGIIEGACRNIVKDRCERSGMRWTIEGVTAFLKLRCILANGDWDAYHDFRMAQRAANLYKSDNLRPTRLDETTVYRFNTEIKRAQVV